MDWSWLILLMCPLMMIPMFFMMKGNHSGHTDQQSNKVNQELDELKKQNERMLQEIHELKR